jgi:hypothetical protein
MKEWLTNDGEKSLIEQELRRQIGHAGPVHTCSAEPPEWLCSRCGKPLLTQEFADETRASMRRVLGVPRGTVLQFPAALENGALVLLTAKIEGDGAVGEFFRAESSCRGAT